MLFKNYPELKIIQEIAKRKKLSVHLVGGFLRDYMLESVGKLPNKELSDLTDFDFAVQKDALKVAKAFSKKVKGAYVLLDQERGCARVAKKKNGKIYTFDFADYRAKTFKRDLNHRDFTINTLSLDIGKIDKNSTIINQLQDHKAALKDLRLGKIILTSKNVFKEDPLRMLRAFSLLAILNFKINQETISQIKKDKGLIGKVSYERIRDELFKVLKTKQAADVLKRLNRIGLLELIIPQIKVMFHCKQGGYHHLDVWPHSLETVVQMEKVFEQMKDNSEVAQYLNENLGSDRPRYALMKLAALLHDIGKPDTRKREGNRLTFHAHERVGRNIVKHITKLLKLSTKERHMLEDMVLWHLRPGYLSNFKNPSQKAVFRYFRDTTEEAMSICLLSLADQRSTCGSLTTKNDQMHHEKICLGMVQKYLDKKKEKPFIRLISGNDLIKNLKLKPSNLFGKILLEVEEQQNLGNITTKKQALELAKKIVHSL